MSRLEERYRSVLRTLPAAYRQRWEDDMVDTFLASAEAGVEDDEARDYLHDCGRPGRSEVASVVALAVRLRLGGTDAPPRSFLWGEAVRTVALVGLLVHAVLATLAAGTMLWLAGTFPALPAPPAGPQFTTPEGWRVAWSLTGLIWVAAYVSLVLNR